MLMEKLTILLANSVLTILIGILGSWTDIERCICPWTLYDSGDSGTWILKDKPCKTELGPCSYIFGLQPMELGPGIQN